MSTHQHTLDHTLDDLRGSPWPALMWIVLAALTTVVAFLAAPLP